MKQATWFVDRNNELLEQIDALRKHALDEQSPWGISLGMLEKELRKSMSQQITLLEDYEKIRDNLQAEFDVEKEKILAQHETEIMHWEEQISQLTDRIGEMEKLREEENETTTRTLMFKEAELDKLRKMFGVSEQSLRRRRLVKIGLGVLAALFVLGYGGRTIQQTFYWRTKTYPLPYSRPSAVAVQGGRIVVSDWVTQSIYSHRISGELPVARVIAAQGNNFSGLSGTGQRTFAADRWAGKILTLNLHGAELETTGEMKPPSGGTAGIYFAENILWTADPAAGRLYRVDLESPGREARAYKVGRIRPLGVVRRKDRFWVLDQKTATVFRNKPRSDLDRPESWEAMTPAFPSDGPRPIGIAASEDSLWILMVNPAQLIRYNFRYLEEE